MTKLAITLNAIAALTAHAAVDGAAAAREMFPIGQQKRVPMTHEQISALRDVSNERRRHLDAKNWCDSELTWYKPSNTCADGTEYEDQAAIVDGDYDAGVGGTIGCYGIHDAYSAAQFVGGNGFHACLAVSYTGNAYSVDASGTSVAAHADLARARSHHAAPYLRTD